LAVTKKRRKPLRRAIRLAQLELLAAMEVEPTLTAAARATRLAQPAASRLLNVLSQDLGVELFERSGRTLRPTAAGRALLSRATRFMADLDRIDGELEAIDRGLVGSASLGTGVASSYVVVPRAVNLMLKAQPRITVTVREGAMAELLAKLREGSIDLLVGRVDHSGNHDLIIEDLYDPAMAIVCGQQHRLARKRKLDWPEILDQQWILPESGTPMRSAVEALFHRHGRRPDECLIESSSIQFNVGLLNSHELLWVLSADIAAYFQRLRVLQVLNLPLMTGPSPFVLVYPRDRRLSPAAERLADCLKDAAREISASFTSGRADRAR
jgi:DNA-binding transcriptional LysR family regulator